MIRFLPVKLLDKSRQCSGLARTSPPGHQNQPLIQFLHLLPGLWRPDFRQARNPLRQQADGQRRKALLKVSIDTKTPPGKGPGKVNVPLLSQPFPLLFLHKRRTKICHKLLGKRAAIHSCQQSIAAHMRPLAYRQMDIRGRMFDCRMDKVLPIYSIVHILTS